MKKSLIILTLISFALFQLALVNYVHAVATPSANNPTPTTKAQDLLDRVATKVAELSNQMRRTYQGQIKSAARSTYTITTSEGERKIVTNSATSFYKIKAGARSEVEFVDLKASDYISAVGTVDPSSNELLAKQIISKVHRTSLVGEISQITKKTIITIHSSDGNDYQVDLDGTPLKKIDPTGKIVLAKLADFTQGKVIFVIAVSPDPKTEIYDSLKALIK